MFRFLWHLGHLTMAVEQHRAIRGDTSHRPVALSKGMASMVLSFWCQAGESYGKS